MESDFSNPKSKPAIPGWRLALLAVATLGVANCASSGGSSGATGSGTPSLPVPDTDNGLTLPPQTASPSTFETSEYFFNVGLDQINASTAYSYGATGEGVLVAVIDTGVDANHPDLQGQVSNLSTDLYGRDPTDLNPDGHGTFVASIIAGRKGNFIDAQAGNGLHGVAFEAEILDIRTDADGTGGNGDFFDPDIISAIEYAVDNGAQIINLSLGGDVTITDQALENAVYAATQAGVLVVVSAGNEAVPGATNSNGDFVEGEGASPLEPAYVAGTLGANGLVVAVGSIDPNGKISSFSNRAGDTADYYLLAPGDFIDNGGSIVGVVGAGPDDDLYNPGDPDNDADSVGDFWFVAGTSFAAPHVSGALALLLDAFPSITPQDALSILLESADDYVDTQADIITGQIAGAGADSVSGVGVMNLAAAFSPSGVSVVTLNGVSQPIQALAASPTGALGDWASNSGAFDNLLTTDAYGRGFTMDAPSRAAALRFIDLAARERARSGQGGAVDTGAFSFSWSQPRLQEDPRLPYAQEADATFRLGLAFAHGEFHVGRGENMAAIAPYATLTHDPAAGLDSIGGEDVWAMASHDLGPVRADLHGESGPNRDTFGFGLSKSGANWIVRTEIASETERESAFGGALQSLFGHDDSARHNTLKIEAAHDLGHDLTVRGAIEAGQSHLAGIDASGLRTSAWAIGLDGRVNGDRLSLVLSQPRRAESGSLAFLAPAAMTDTGALIFETRRADLLPSGRELDLEARWSKRLNTATEIDLAAALVNDAGHVASDRIDHVMWVSVNTTW